MATAFEEDISNFFVKNGFACENVIFCRTPAFLFFRIGGIPMVTDTLSDISVFIKRKVLTEKTRFPESRKTYETKLTSHQYSTYTYTFKGLKELKKLLSEKALYIVYAYDGFWDALAHGEIRMVKITSFK